MWYYVNEIGEAVELAELVSEAYFINIWNKHYPMLGKFPS